jgi:hypothetical protein
MLKGGGSAALAEADRGQGIAPDGAARSENRPRPGPSLRQADGPAPRRGRRPASALLGSGRARRAHLYRLPAQRPWYGRHRSLVAAARVGFPVVAPVELAPARARIRPNAFTIEKPPAQITRQVTAHGGSVYTLSTVRIVSSMRWSAGNERAVTEVAGCSGCAQLHHASARRITRSQSLEARHAAARRDAFCRSSPTMDK